MKYTRQVLSVDGINIYKHSIQKRTSCR